ncbi:hypothetical protein IEQ34_012569 [Dendrobium chrysotoxum]|uniref:Replication protein A C-terminal domain-containing protein n=1 Tax=Dendrobium chrysotoxum TaxID=161865 RepID=A0AAV7GX00_DENCH|nr:hypothetical protein IEQ34_012569 [Dendrobium chrysotoxum]
MLSADQFAGAPLFTGGAFLPSQSIDSSISPTKSQIRTPNTLIPMTVKQIIEAYHSSEDKPTIIVDGIELANVKLVGLVMNRMERETEVSFTLDDGTGRIDFRRWANVSSDTGDTAFIQPLTDFNDIVLHFLECIHIHLGHIRVKVLPFFEGDTARMQMNINIGPSFSNGRDSASEHGLHVDELFRRLSLPKNQIMEAINYLVDVGHIYSTVDEYHFKSANNC